MKKRKKGKIERKNLSILPSKTVFQGSNPYHIGKTRFCIFLVSRKTDFQKCEENGVKTRKTEENLGFSGCIFFGRISWPARQDSNLRPQESESCALSSWATGSYSVFRARSRASVPPPVASARSGSGLRFRRSSSHRSLLYHESPPVSSVFLKFSAVFPRLRASVAPSVARLPVFLPSFQSV